MNNKKGFLVADYLGWLLLAGGVLIVGLAIIYFSKGGLENLSKLFRHIIGR